MCPLLHLRHLLLPFHTHVMPKKSAESGYLNSVLFLEQEPAVFSIGQAWLHTHPNILLLQ